MPPSFTLTPVLTHAAAEIQFRNGTDIVNFFQTVTKRTFIEWFNDVCANKASWAHKALGTGPDVSVRFVQIWNNIPLLFDKEWINLIEFISLMSILINEVGADLLPVTELCGHGAFKGLMYAFEKIPGLKMSYNVCAGNRPAGSLFFEDDVYWTAHKALPAADLVRSHPELRNEWNGATYPARVFTTSLDPAEAGFIHQADFFKFRGRGFIQTTFRANYKPIVDFVQHYQGTDPTVLQYKTAWAGKKPDEVCTASTNDDWDRLFQDRGLVAACRAVAIHNATCGRYLSLSTDPAVLGATSEVRGSLFYMGLRINGSRSYASTFLDRVLQDLAALNYTGRGPTS